MLTMALFESEDNTLIKMNTFNINLPFIVTIKLNKDGNNWNKRNVEEHNSSPQCESIHGNSITNNTSNGHVEHSAAVKVNQMHYLLYRLSKNLISIFVKYYLVAMGKCDYFNYLDLKNNLFKKSENTIINIILPHHREPLFMEKFFSVTKDLAKSSNGSISILDIKTLLREMIYSYIYKIENDQRENNNKNPWLADRLKCMAKFFTKPERSCNHKKTTAKRKYKHKNDMRTNMRKQNKTTSEEEVSSTSNGNLISEISSSTQTSVENILYGYGNKTALEPSNAKYILPGLLTTDNNEKIQLEPGDISSTVTEQCHLKSISTNNRDTTALTPQTSLAAVGICRMCNAKTRNLCIGCLSYYYCSLECQVLEWPQHKHECIKST